MVRQAWELVPQVGIKAADIAISFVMSRNKLRSLMAGKFLPPEDGSYPDEDDFLAKDDSTLIRVRYAGTVVQDIEFLKGSLSYEGTSLHSDTTFSEIEDNFKAKGLTFRSAQWLGDGQDCPELGINIATQADVGGDGDVIEWVIMSSDFK
jgi:hypothetical protein